MKCLEKDRTRRYETANGLADDVLRHLNNEPVAARPPSRLYRFQKLVRRNKLAFAAGAAVVGALVIGLGLSTWFLFKRASGAASGRWQRRRSKPDGGQQESAEAQFLQRTCSKELAPPSPRAGIRPCCRKSSIKLLRGSAKN